MNIEILKKLGFSDKAAKIYLALLTLGPSSVRSLAEFCSLNRGTTYDTLKWLQDQGVVTFYKKDTKQQFVAEHPDTLKELITKRESELLRVKGELKKQITELTAIYDKGGERPVARYFLPNELHLILEDLLETCEQSDEKMYRIYSTEGVREYLYESFPTFSDARIEKGISVKVIAIGEGGTLRGLDERRWIHKKPDAPTYILMYSEKTAYISLNAKGEPIGVVIENQGVEQMQTLIFDQLWETLNTS